MRRVTTDLAGSRDDRGSIEARCGVLLTALVVALSAAAAPAAAQTAIRPGQTVAGELSASDPTLVDDSHYDCFALQTRQGQTLQIDQMSEAFDSYLQVGTGGCTRLDLLQSDDDSGGGTNARLTVEGDGATRTIRVNSLLAGQTGAYRLRVSEVGSRVVADASPTPAAASSGSSANPGLRASQGPYSLLTRQNSQLMFLEQGSVRRDGDIAHVTSFLAGDAESLAREQISHIAMANEFDCAAERFRVVSGRGYRADGSFVGETAGDSTWRPIITGSPSERMFNVGCRGQAPTGRVLGNSPEAVSNDFRLGRDPR